MRGLRYILAVALLLPTLSFAGWSVDLPLADMPPTNAPVDNYSRYVQDMLKGIGERAAATYTGSTSGSAWVVTGNTLTYTAQSYDHYNVMPPQADAFNLDYVHPDAIGSSLYHYLGWSLYTDGSLTNVDILPLYTKQMQEYPPSGSPSNSTTKVYVPQRITREEMVYTNYTTITNYSTLVYTRLDGAVVTNRALIGVYNIGGEFVTNTVYDAIHTNIYPAYGTNITGPAYMLLNNRQGVADVTPSSTLTYYSDIAYTPYTNIEQVTYPKYIQYTNVVATNITLHAWDAAATSYVDVVGQLNYTSYVFAADGLVTADVAYAGMQLDLEKGTATASDALTVFTPYVKVGIDDVALDPALMPYISWLILECAPYYVDTAILDTYSSTNSWQWEWLAPTNMRPVNLYSVDAWVKVPVKALSMYTPETLLTHSGAGTNVMRYSMTVYTNDYPEASDPAWYTLSATRIPVELDGWEVGAYTTETTNVLVSAYTNAVYTNLGFNAFPAHTMQVPLAKFTTQPLSEDEVTLHGFTRHFWYGTTNYMGDVYAPQEWLESINGLTATNAGIAWGAYEYYAFAGRLEAIIAWPGGWVIVDDYTTGLPVVRNWEALFGTNIVKATEGFHQLGYPTKEDNRTAGWPTLNYTNNVVNRYPSGYYFPGGTVRPSKYTVGVMYSDGQDIAEAYDYTWGDGNRAAPYWLDRIPVSYLADWSNTFVTVKTDAPNATAVPTISIPIDYRYFYVDDLGVTVGLRNRDNPTASNRLEESSAIAVTSLSEVQALGRAVLDVRGETYAGGTVATTMTVNADSVWVESTNTIIDTYFVAGVTVVTNIEGAVTNITYRPTLTATSDILAHNPATCVSLITVSMATSNTVAVFDTTIDERGGSTYEDFVAFTPAAVDARYAAINALKSLEAEVVGRFYEAAYRYTNRWYTNKVVAASSIGFKELFSPGAPWTTNSSSSTNIATSGPVGADATELTLEIVVEHTSWASYQPTWYNNVDGIANIARISGVLPPVWDEYSPGLWSFKQSYTTYEPTFLSGEQSWLFPVYGGTPAGPPTALPQRPFGNIVNMDYASSTNTGSYESFDLVTWTNYTPIGTARAASNLTFTVTKSPQLAGTVDVYMYVDYTAHDYTTVHFQDNSITLASAVNDLLVSHVLPYDCYWFIPGPGDGDPNWSTLSDNQDGIYIGLGPKPYFSVPDYIPATTIYSTTNRALTIPSHQYYPLDAYLTPYVLKKYVSAAAPVGAPTVSAAYYVPSTPSNAVGSLGKSTSITNVPLTTANTLDTWYLIDSPRSWAKTQPYEVWEQWYIPGFQQFVDGPLWELKEEVSVEMEYQSYTPLPYKYRAETLEATFSPEFEYHD